MKKETTEQTSPEEFSNMVNLMAVFSEASNRLEELQSGCNGQYLELIDDHKAEYAKLQSTLTETESALELIALKHPEWFQKRKSVKTPYGTVKFHKGTKIEFDDPEKVMLRMELHSKDNKDFKFDDFIKTERVLNKEALENLDDAMLTRFGARRVSNDNFSVVPAKVDMGKAVKESVEQEVAA